MGEDLGTRERNVVLDDGRLMPGWVRRLIFGAILFGAPVSRVTVPNVTDKLRDVGKYFDGVGQYAELPGVLDVRRCTLEGWFIWLAGRAALLRDASPGDGGWSLGYERDGQLSYRVAGTDRRTPVPVDELRDGWHHYLLTKDGPRVVYFLDGDPIDAWSGASDTAPLGPWALMKDGPNESYIEGFAADVAMYEHALTVERVRVHWEVGRIRI